MFSVVLTSLAQFDDFRFEMDFLFQLNFLEEFWVGLLFVFAEKMLRFKGFVKSENGSLPNDGVAL